MRGEPVPLQSQYELSLLLWPLSLLIPLLPNSQAALQKELGLPVDPNAPLFGFIGRLVRRGEGGKVGFPIIRPRVDSPLRALDLSLA